MQIHVRQPAAVADCPAMTFMASVADVRPTGSGPLAGWEGGMGCRGSGSCMYMLELVNIAYESCAEPLCAGASSIQKRLPRQHCVSLPCSATWSDCRCSQLLAGKWQVQQDSTQKALKTNRTCYWQSQILGLGKLIIQDLVDTVAESNRLPCAKLSDDKRFACTRRLIL